MGYKAIIFYSLYCHIYSFSRQLWDLKIYIYPQKNKKVELIVSPNFKIKILRADFVYKNLKISINPKPDTLIRLIFYFQVTNDTNEKLIAPKIYSPVRKGFTALLGCFYTSWRVTT